MYKTFEVWYGEVLQSSEKNKPIIDCLELISSLKINVSQKENFYELFCCSLKVAYEAENSNLNELLKKVTDSKNEAEGQTESQRLDNAMLFFSSLFPKKQGEEKTTD